jgi:hypothetical protein
MAIRLDAVLRKYAWPISWQLWGRYYSRGAGDLAAAHRLVKQNAGGVEVPQLDMEVAIRHLNAAALVEVVADTMRTELRRLRRDIYLRGTAAAGLGGRSI